MLDRSFVEKIVDLSAVQKIDIDGRPYTSKEVKPVFDPKQSALTTVSLSSIKTYFQRNPDNVDLSKAIVHVVSPTEVLVQSPVTGDWKHRDRYVNAECKPRQYRYENYMPVETFMIAIQTYFVQSETTAKLLQVIGNLSVDSGVKTQDDGVTQTVTAKVGVTQLANVSMPNPIVLAPYRTFCECPQPESKFILRLKTGDGGATAALFEADGGNWTDDAMNNVEAWLVANLPDGTIVMK